MDGGHLPSFSTHQRRFIILSCCGFTDAGAGMETQWE